MYYKDTFFYHEKKLKKCNKSIYNAVCLWYYIGR